MPNGLRLKIFGSNTQGVTPLHTHTHTHTHTHARTHTRGHTHTHIHTYTYTYTHRHTHTLKSLVFVFKKDHFIIDRALSKQF